MNEGKSGNKSNNPNLEKKTALGTHVFCLGTDVWQLQIKKIEAIKKLLPQNNKLDKIIQIAQVLDKHQKEIDYYQSRIRNTLNEITKRNNENSKEYGK